MLDRSLWRVFIALTALAFAFQNFVMQTHIHVPQAVEAALAHGAGAVTQTVIMSSQNSTSPDDTATCPICQEVTYAGQYLSPTAIAVLPPTISVAIVPVALHLLRIRSPLSHAWQGRGPPTL